MRGLAAFLLALHGVVPSARAFNQPPLNLGLTSLLDGGPVAPGLYLVEYVQFSEGGPPKNADGDRMPGDARAGAVANVNQLLYLSPVRFLNGYLGLDFVLPVVGVSANGRLGGAPLSANSAGFGDLVVGPLLQWNGAALLGRPFFQRVELDFVLPTGKYDPRFAANPGSNLMTAEAYYSFTWLLSDAWETSWRLFYAVHGRNPDTKVEPGDAFHLNYAVSRSVHPKLRLGAAGHLLEQTTDDRAAGSAVRGSRERSLALGPALGYLGEGLAAFLSHQTDLDARNRFRESRTTLQMIHRF